MPKKRCLGVVNSNNLKDGSINTAKAIDVLYKLGYTLSSNLKDQVDKYFTDVEEAYMYICHLLPLKKFPWYKKIAVRDKIANFLTKQYLYKRIETFEHDIRYLAHYILPKLHYERYTYIHHRYLDDILINIGINLHQQAKNNLLLCLLQNKMYLRAVECIYIGADVNYVGRDNDALYYVLKMTNSWYPYRGLRPRGIKIRAAQNVLWRTMLEFGLKPNPDLHMQYVSTAIEEKFYDGVKVMLLYWKLPYNKQDVINMIQDREFNDTIVALFDIDPKYIDTKVFDTAVDVNNVAITEVCMKHRIRPSGFTLKKAHEKMNGKVVNYCMNYYTC